MACSDQVCLSVAWSTAGSRRPVKSRQEALGTRTTLEAETVVGTKMTATAVATTIVTTREGQYDERRINNMTTIDDGSNGSSGGKDNNNTDNANNTDDASVDSNTGDSVDN